MTTALLRLPDVIKRVGFKKTAIYQLMKQGRFPKSISLSTRTVVWRDDEIQAWITAQLP